MPDDEVTPVAPVRRHTPHLRLGVSPEEDQLTLDAMDGRPRPGKRTGETPVASKEFMRTISRLEREIEGLRGKVADLERVVGSSREELVKAREELHEVLTLLKDQHKAQEEARTREAKERREAREQAATERREARAKLFEFLGRMLSPFVDDPWFRRGALVGLSGIALVLGGVTYIQLSKDGVTVGQRVQAAEIQRLEAREELDPASSSRP